MKKEEKIRIIMDDIGVNYNEFLHQAGSKLNKHRHLFNSNNENYELVSDIIDSIVIKFDDFRKVNQFYNMVKDDTLKLYIFKSIDINCISFKAPFLREKLKLFNLKELSDKLSDDIFNAMDEDTRKFTEMPTNKQLLIKRIYTLLSYPKARELFGDHWKYLTGLFKEYIDDPNATYRSLGEKYNISATTVNSHIRKVIIKIKEELNENN